MNKENLFDIAISKSFIRSQKSRAKKIWKSIRPFKKMFPEGQLDFDFAVKNGMYYTPKRIVKYTEKQIAKQVKRYEKGLNKCSASFDHTGKFHHCGCICDFSCMENK